MNKSSLFALIFSVLAIENTHAQTPLTLSERSFKVAGLGEDAFYFGATAGDKIIIDFKEVNGKELKEFEVIQLPSNSKVAEYKTTAVNKEIVVDQKSIFKVRLYNSALGGRICKLNVYRTPGSIETQKFDSNVYWRTIYDTTYTTRVERYVVKQDTTASSVMSQVAKVAAKKTTIADFYIPENTIAWSYYIGVGKDGQKEYDRAVNKFNTAVTGALKTFGSYDLMASLALSGLSLFTSLQGSENVRYYFIPDWNNVQLFQSGSSFARYKEGNIVNEASQMKGPLIGKAYIGLFNDNDFFSIDVMIKVTAVQVNTQFAERTVKDQNIATFKVPFLKD